MGVRSLPSDRLPKGTRVDLQLLLRRVRELQVADVRMPRSGVAALSRVVVFLGCNDLEGKPRA